MVRIKSIDFGDEGRVTFSGNTPWNYPFGAGIILSQEPISSTSVDRRVEGEYLKQGKRLDSYGNNEVDNVQLKGNVAVAPVFSEYSATALVNHGSAGYGIQCITASDMVPYLERDPHTSPGYFMLDYGMCAWGYAWQSYQYDPSHFGVSCYCAAPILVDTKNGKRKSWYGFTLQIEGGWIGHTIAEQSWGESRPFGYSCIYEGYMYRSYAYAAQSEYMKKAFNDAFRHYVFESPQRTILDVLAWGKEFLLAEAKSRTENRCRSSSPYALSRYSTISSVLGAYLGSSEIPDTLDMIIPKLGTTLDGLATFTDKELSLHGRDCVEAYNDFSSNVLAYAADLGKTGDTIKSMFKLVGNIKNPKAWASAWLSYRYGDRLFIADTKELLESVSKRLTVRSDRTIARAATSKTQQSATFTATRRRTSTLYAYNDSFNGVMTGVNNLMRWDAWPTLENTWDLIPLSFVVDWFLPVNDLLGQIDAAVQAPYIKVESAYVGEKLTVDFTLSSEIVGALTYTHYQRFRHNPTSDIRPFDVEITPPSFSVTHATDALALITQLGSRHR